MAAMRAYMEDLVRHTNVYNGLAASLGAVLQVGTPGCQATSAEGTRLLHSAQEAGAVRDDVSFDDVVCVATAISLATQHASAPQPQIAHLVDVFFNGIAVRNAKA